MPDGADEESDEGGNGAGEAWPRGTVNVSPEEVMDWNVPLARELKPVLCSEYSDRRSREERRGKSIPVTGIPPVRVKVSVRKAGDLRKSA